MVQKVLELLQLPYTKLIMNAHRTAPIIIQINCLSISISISVVPQKPYIPYFSIIAFSPFVFFCFLILPIFLSVFPNFSTLFSYFYNFPYFVIFPTFPLFPMVLILPRVPILQPILSLSISNIFGIFLYSLYFPVLPIVHLFLNILYSIFPSIPISNLQGIHGAKQS